MLKPWDHSQSDLSAEQLACHEWCRFDAVIHFAGRKAVGESVQQPWLYYDHNVLGAINLVEVMREHNVKNVSLPSPLRQCMCRQQTLNMPASMAVLRAYARARSHDCERSTHSVYTYLQTTVNGLGHHIRYATWLLLTHGTLKAPVNLSMEGRRFMLEGCRKHLPCYHFVALLAGFLAVAICVMYSLWSMGYHPAAQGESQPDHQAQNLYKATHGQDRRLHS